MSTIRIAMFSDDASLANSAALAVANVKHCTLHAVDRERVTAEGIFAMEDVGLLLFHVVTASDEQRVLELLCDVSSSGMPLAILVVCDQPDPTVAARLLSRGAADVLVRPLDLNRLAFLVDTLTLRLRYRPRPNPPATPECAAPWEALPESLHQLQALAQRSTTILLAGETGTGKTRLARSIHEHSRPGKPFLDVHCATISENLIGSELFGHVKGAFTGADTARIGKLAAAADGTLLLDDIDALGLDAQAKLLRAVDERRFEPVGGNQSFPLRARLIVATNRSLWDEVAGGRFREDLYFRLDVASFRLPPLRERRWQIEALATGFVNEFASRERRSPPHISPGVLAALQAYDWPGNVRELRNAMERATAVCNGGEITLDDLPETLRGGNLRSFRNQFPSGNELRRTKRDLERSVISEALKKHANNRVQTAHELGISRAALYKKLRQHGMA